MPTPHFRFHRKDIVFKFHSAMMKVSENDFNIRQPFQAKCRKCGETIYFDIDPAGTPGFNGDWGDGNGDYGCSVDNGDDSEDGNAHIPFEIQYNRKLYPHPDLLSETPLSSGGNNQ